MARDIYQEVTDKIVESLENGTVPWQRPWNVIGVPPTNLYTRKKYRGINVFLLGMAGYASPFFVTFKQAQDLMYKQWCRDNGKTINDPASQAEYNNVPLDPEETWVDEDGHEHTTKSRRFMPKGTKGHLVVFFKPIPNKRYRKGSQDPKEQNKTILILKHYTVFNVEQIKGLRIPEELQPELVEDHDPLPEAQRIIDEYLDHDGPTFEHGGDRAYYRPPTDHVQMPLMAQFNDVVDYYKTAYHELAHSTGAESRLNRKELADLDTTFGDDKYSQEELTAEMTAAMLAGVAGLQFSYENTAAYLKNWATKLGGDPLHKIEGDKRLIIRAAAKAQKAADLILGVEPFDPNAAETTEREQEAVPA